MIDNANDNNNSNNKYTVIITTVMIRIVMKTMMITRNIIEVIDAWQIKKTMTINITDRDCDDNDNRIWGNVTKQ